MIRVIAGIYKGFILQSLPGKNTRPTSSKVRGAIFDIIGGRIIDSEFLDIFSGTGAVGIEAISRGAKNITFVEINEKAIKIIKTNLLKIKQADFHIIIKDNYLSALSRISAKKKKYDIIFLDPPYNKNIVIKSLFAIEQSNILKRGSIVIAQHAVLEDVQSGYKNLFYIKGKKYGKTRLSIFEFNE